MTPHDPPLRTVPLRDGREIVIRRIGTGDLESSLQMETLLLRTGIGQIRSPDELPETIDEYRKNMAKWIDGDHSGYKGLYMVAISARRVIGGGRVRRSPFRRLRHNGNIGLGIHPDFQGLGVGRAIMIAMIDWAKNHSFIDPAKRAGGITRLDLGVFADNRRAIKLYESLGFVRVGHRHGFIQFEDGSTMDDYEMELRLNA